MSFNDYSFIDIDENEICRILHSLRNKDISIWDSHPGTYEKVMGWIGAIHSSLEAISENQNSSPFHAFPDYTDVVFIGFGGSILGAQVLIHTLSTQVSIKVWYVDTVDTEEIDGVQNSINVRKTIFVVASKSGSTLETKCLERYFFQRSALEIGYKDAGSRFFAITDPNSDLDVLAREKSYQEIVYGDPCVAGRFSALTPYGLFPASLLGVDIDSFIQATRRCIGSLDTNSYFAKEVIKLICFLASSLKRGRDKLTIQVSPKLNTLVIWIEQLLSESLGKDGRGIILVTREADMDISQYGSDRTFLFIEHEEELDPKTDKRISDLIMEGFPAFRIEIGETDNNVGSEIYKWELAVAVLGNLLRINPFDQPEVDCSKNLATNLMANVAERDKISTKKNVLSLRELLQRCKPGHYIGILAFLPRRGEIDSMVGEIRKELTRITGVPTTLGYGPAYLHSTGQCHKGGPRNGLFIQITYDAECDIAVPDTVFSFADIIKAQAEGDFQAMIGLGIPITRYHLGHNRNESLRSMLNTLKTTVS